LADEIGIENIIYFCKSIGIGESYAIDGFFISGGKIPDITKKHSPAYKANFSFGQGDLLLSPVDIMNLFSVGASGTKQEFSIVKGVYREQNKSISYLKTSVPQKILKDETVKILREMMKECVLNGTGILAKCDNVSVGGKTATAQSGQYKGKNEVLHKWFAGVFPIDEPKYLIVVLCDGNGNNNVPPALIFSKIAGAISEDF
jgi:penicillin-binding protein 2